MGSSQPNFIQEESCGDDFFRVTLHHHNHPTDLFRIFKLFTQDPFKLVEQISLQPHASSCYTLSAIQVTTIRHKLTLENLATIKRIGKQAFVEKQIWYFIKTAVGLFVHMQANNVYIGAMNLNTFPLDSGRYLKFEVLHLLPNNEHLFMKDIGNYYSPQMIEYFKGNLDKQDIDFAKSQVFQFGLLLLQLLTCPLNKPKFHSPDIEQLLFHQIHKRCQNVQERRSQKMIQLLQMTLRKDVRTRPDWNFLKIWVHRNQAQIDIAPCIFWII